MTKKTKTPRLPEAELFALADEYEKHHAREGRAKKEKKGITKTLVEQIQSLRKLGSLESDKFGRFTRITVVQAEHVEYDEDRLWKTFTPAQRRESFDSLVNLNALPLATRKAIIEMVPRDELKAVSSRRLNVERMSQAVQAGKIDAKVIAPFSEIVKNEPYISISHGKGA
jgi:hypothetical protein